MKTKALKIMAVIYVLMFFVNLICAVIDTEDTDIPEYCFFKGNTGGIASRPINYYLYTENGGYYLGHYDPEKEEIVYRDEAIKLTREQYKRCIPRTKDLENAPSVISSMCGNPNLTIKLKYPGCKTQRYAYGNNINAFRYLCGVDQVLSEIEEDDKKDSDKVYDALLNVFEEYDVMGAQATYRKASDATGIYYRGFYDLDEQLRNREAYQEICKRLKAEYINMKLWTDGYIDKPYSFSDLKDIEKIYVEKTGNSSAFSTAEYPLYIPKRFSTKAKFYIRFFYCVNVLKGIHVSYFKSIDLKDYAAFFFASPDEGETAIVFFMTDDLIARPGLYLAVFRVLLTDGRLGVIPGERTFCHAIFIVFVQTFVFGLAYCLLSARKWYNILRAKRTEKDR